MTKYGSDDVGFFLIDGNNVLGVVTELSDEITDNTEETTALGDSWRKHASVGMGEATFIVDAEWDLKNVTPCESELSKVPLKMSPEY